VSESPAEPGPTDGTYSAESDGDGDIREVVANVLRPYDIPADEVEAAAGRIQSVAFQEFHHGPIPSAREMAAYERISPGFSDRVMKMAEGEQGHRHRSDNRALIAEIALKVSGQALAVMSLAMMLSLVGFFVVHGAAEQGAKLGIAIVAVVVTAFLAPKIIRAVRPSNSNHDHTAVTHARNTQMVRDDEHLTG
jgi:uncharacterized membrane protein